MKKFLKKLPVMITLVALSVVLLGFYIYMIARPVSYGMGYKYTEKTDDNNYYTNSVVVQNNKKAKMSSIGKLAGEDMKESATYWIATKGNKFIMVGVAEADGVPAEYCMTEEQYNATVKLLTDENFENYGIKSSAFKFTVGGDTYTCTGAIVFAVVGGVVELALLSFATLSVIFFIQDKKKKD